MFELVNGRDLTGAASSRPRVTKLRTDGPIGDERYFVAVRKVGSEHLWQWSIDADPGDELIVRAYVNNSCADNYGHGCWLQGTTLTLESFHKPGRTSFAANLDAVNAKRVWDGVEIKTNPNATVELVPGSVTLESNAHPGSKGGLSLDQAAAFEDGVVLGYEEMDGEIRPGYQYALYVTFRVRVVQ
jgi:hypothetical protein